ncbi:serine hydrolase domain-containing protein [Aquimarina litoralis]|uniref:serine hydrolase domain-containing protein n=1 Tax=Aquimarina litoralis TaxID=584605 RepID=UPI001C584B02|nr:serine hydrolase domain-containing protein [Aquimarina litoralis]MBW1298580.1 serine hydrolase [Aquimarina litoralis]
MKYIYLIMLSAFFNINAQNSNALLLNKLDVTSENPVHSISVYIKKQDSVYIDQAVGLREKKGEKTLSTDQFRIASGTKLFVSTIVLQMQEEGKLSLSDKIYSYLKGVDYLQLDDFHYLEDISFVKEISIKQLLLHKSGIADIFNDKQEAFFERLMQNPEQQYQPKDVVNLYFEFGLNKEPKCKPDTCWYYSDMNYVLLGLLIEKLEQKSLSQSIRDRILYPLDLKNTYFEFYENTKTNKPRIHQYVGNIDFNSVNTSFDWSGGGLLSTHQDLATFIEALFEGKLVSKQSLEKMIAVQPTIDNHLPYGLGIYKSIYNGDVFFGHYGFYGTYIGYSPETKTVLSYCISQATPSFNTYEFVNTIVKNIK